jgi:hypothetical protein
VDASAPARADPWLFRCAACPPTPISAGSLRALWLEGNGFTKIEGLDTLSELRCLYAHQNCLSKIENLNCCPLLASLQLSNNHILTISNISHLSQLQTLQIANNYLTTADDIRHLLEVPNLTVLDLQNNRLEDPEILDVLAAMPSLAVLQLQGNPVVPKITQYRRTTISRCTSLSYLDDRPVFEEERKAVGAWVIGGLPAEREERRRQREEKDLAHRRNLDHMISLMKKTPTSRHVDGFNNPLPEVEDDETEEEKAARRAEEKRKREEEEMSERDMYTKALNAVERKKRELMKQKAERAAAEAALEGVGVPASGDGDFAEASGAAAARPSTAPAGSSGGAAAAAERPSTAPSYGAEDADEEEESALPPLQSSAGAAAGQEGESAFDQAFVAAPSFAGAKPGFVFKKGARGLGYYRDGSAEPMKPAAARKAGADMKLEEADDLEDLD